MGSLQSHIQSLQYKADRANRKARWLSDDRLSALRRVPIEDAASRSEIDRDFDLREATAAAEIASLEAEIERLRAHLSALKKEGRSDYGLAPWDTPFLQAQSALADSSEPVSPTRVLTAAEVAVQFREGLGVSRSSFYERYRRLLRSYQLAPSKFIHSGAQVYYIRGGVTRFDAAEVECLIAAIRDRKPWF